MTPADPRIEQQRAALREMVNMSISGHRDALASGADPAWAFHVCAEMLAASVVEAGTPEDLARAVKVLAQFGSEVALMVAAPEATSLPGTFEQRMAVSDAVAADHRERTALNEAHSRHTLAELRMLTRQMMPRDDDAMDDNDFWLMIYNHIERNARADLEVGVPPEILAGRLAALVAHVVLSGASVPNES